jgi:hypothetical protein
VLQKLEHDAKLALVLAKYLPPSPAFGAELVVAAIQGAAGGVISFSHSGAQ